MGHGWLGLGLQKRAREKEKGVRRERSEGDGAGNPNCGEVWIHIVSGNRPTGIKLILTSTNGLAGKASVGIKER